MVEDQHNTPEYILIPHIPEDILSHLYLLYRLTFPDLLSWRVGFPSRAQQTPFTLIQWALSRLVYLFYTKQKWHNNCVQLLPFTQKVFAIEFINSIIGVAVIFKLNKSKALQNYCSISTHLVLMTILQKNCGESLTCLIRTSVLRPYPLKNLSKSFSLNGKNDVMPSVKYHLSSMDITVVQDRQENIPAIWGQVPNVDSAAPWHCCTAILLWNNCFLRISDWCLGKAALRSSEWILFWVEGQI